MDESDEGASLRIVNDAAKTKAIAELKRRGKASWGATYYSQMAPVELCQLAGRPRAVQYGALISWLKRLGNGPHDDPTVAVDLVAHLIGERPADIVEIAVPGSVQDGDGPSSESESSEGRLIVNCPSVVHDHRFVVLGELPEARLYSLVLLQPLDGTGYWYPQVAAHNPLRAGRAFSSFVRLGNPSGIWHTKKPPLDAKIRVLALKNEWDPAHSERLRDDALEPVLKQLGVVAQKETVVRRIAVDSVEPTLTDQAQFSETPLRLVEPRAQSCVAPLSLSWRGGAAFIEIHEGIGDRLVFGGSAAPGATLTVRGGLPTSGEVLFEFEHPGPYRVRLYPAVWSFVDPPYEWWLEIS